MHGRRLPDGFEKVLHHHRLRKAKQCTVNTVYSGDDVLLTLTGDFVVKRILSDLLNPTNVPSRGEAGPGDLGMSSCIPRAEVEVKVSLRL